MRPGARVAGEGAVPWAAPPALGHSAPELQRLQAPPATLFHANLGQVYSGKSTKLHERNFKIFKPETFKFGKRRIT